MKSKSKNKDEIIKPKKIIICECLSTNKDIKITKLEDGPPDLIRITHVQKGQRPFNTYHEFKMNDGNIGRYPDYEMVMPKGKLVPMESVNLRPSYLNRLMKGMASHDDTRGGYANMKLEFTGDGKAILCKPISKDYSGCRGLIMPIMET